MSCADACDIGHSFGAALQPVRLDARDLNHDVRPGDDLDVFVNAHWRRDNPIPPGHSYWDCFSILSERSLQMQAQIACEAARSEASVGTPLRIVGDFWAAGMDETQSTANALESLKQPLCRIAALDSPASIAAYLREAHARGEDHLFALDVQPDFTDPRTQTLFVIPQGLGLPSRDLYLDQAPAARNIFKAYATHIATMLELTGVGPAAVQTSATDVIKFERRLARVSMSRKALARDISTRYRPVTIKEADESCPTFSWSRLFSSALRANRISLPNAEFHEEIDAMLRDVPPAAWRAYLHFHTVEQAAAYIGGDIGDAHERFHGGILRGRQSPPPRWKRVLAALNDHVGEAMGTLYAQHHCRRDAYAPIEDLVAQLRQALRERIENLPWMTGRTKQSALEKLAGFTAKIGHPSQPRDWSGFTTSRRSLYDNVVAARSFNRAWILAKMHEPVDSAAWSLTPQTVNARYDPQRNEIILPAAILQPPFFDPDADAALNYGGIGAVIAHEMIHGYDDQGSRFGPDGRFENWWTHDDRASFDALAARLADRFSQCVVEDGAHVDGVLTLGENIADLGGLALACAALRRALATRAQADPMLEGFSQLQRFFLNWAALWRQNLTADERRLRLRADVHAPAKLRANIAAESLAEFSHAFGGRSAADRVQVTTETERIW
jgi:putative endopeptidase